MLSDRQDAFGRSFLELYRTGAGWFAVERDDGFVDMVTMSRIGRYDAATWPQQQQEAMRRAHGRVLDIGCGDGRHAVYLQAQGLEVTGIDNSPLAIQVCRERGLRKSAVVSMTQLSKRRFGEFDTLLALGNNFCMFGTPERARRMLQRLHRMGSDRAILFAQARNPYPTDEPGHLEYHARNRRAGRMSGQARIRVRLRQYATPWTHFLMVSPEEMSHVIAGTGWRATEFLDETSDVFTGILEKE